MKILTRVPSKIFGTMKKNLTIQAVNSSQWKLAKKRFNFWWFLFQLRDESMNLFHMFIEFSREIKAMIANVTFVRFTVVTSMSQKVSFPISLEFRCLFLADFAHNDQLCIRVIKAFYYLHCMRINRLTISFSRWTIVLQLKRARNL